MRHLPLKGCTRIPNGELTQPPYSGRPNPRPILSRRSNPEFWAPGKNNSPLTDWASPGLAASTSLPASPWSPATVSR